MSNFTPLVLYICDQCGEASGGSPIGNSCLSCYKMYGPKAPPPSFPHKYYCNKCGINYNSLNIYKKHKCKN